MRFHTRELIKNLEENLQNSYSLPIFKGYKAINKRGVEKLIDQIYATLPHDVQKAREFLRARQYDYTPQNNTTYETLQNIENTLDEGFPFAQTVILNIRELEKLLEQLQNNLPIEITKAENLSK